jgi:8-amino-7-oxononanoate synthase
MLPAIILCSPLTRQYLINYARPLIYTTFISFPALAAIKAVYISMAQGQTEELARKLATLIAMLFSSLQILRDQYGVSDCIESLVEIPPACPKSPIISLLTPDPRGLAQYCQAAGYVVRAIVAPTVPEGFERVRVCLHSGNTPGQIEGFVQTLQRWIEQEKQKTQKTFELLRARL